MACLHLCLLLALSFVVQAAQNDPIVDFCRRWGHSTAQIDGKLFIDGGMVDWDPIGLNYTNTWLLYSNLNTSTQVSGMPAQFSNLTKPANIPSLSGGTLWADGVNQCFYQFGGEYSPGSSPTPFSMWTYDVFLDQWNSTELTSDTSSFNRVSYGAGTQIESIGRGYYYGGWLNDRTMPTWSGHAMATSGLVRFEFSSGQLRNVSGPDTVGRAEGKLVYLPASDGGLLVYFGGVEDLHQNGTAVGADMTHIHIYDIASSKWYMQTASGDVPAARRQFGADVTWPDDQSSYNIYLYGGYGFNGTAAFDDVYVLSLPSFTWIKAYSRESEFIHGGCSADVIGRNQMLIIGGWFPAYGQCDSPGAGGQHVLNMGYNGPKSSIWDRYDPKLTNYTIPTPIISAIGGGPTGGAKTTAPATWANADLAVYFTRKASFNTRAPTRYFPSDAASPSPDSKKINVGLIVGSTVGGVIGLAAILFLVWFCLRRRKNTQKRKDVAPIHPESPPLAELAATTSRQELPAPDAGKYMSMHPHLGSNTYSTYSEGASSQSPSYGHSSPRSLHSVQPFISTSPTSTRSCPAEAGQQGYAHHNTYPPYPDNRVAYDPQPACWNQHAYPPPSAVGMNHQYPYAPPMSPTMPPSYQTLQPPADMVYFPPPPEPAHHPRYSYEHASNPDAKRGSLDTVQGALSTTSTPAQFYAQPVAVGQPVMGEDFQRSSRLYTDEGGSNRGSGDTFQYGSARERTRPARGRFVEVDHM